MDPKQAGETAVESIVITHCFEGNLIAVKESLAMLEGCLGRRPNPEDFIPQQDPAVAACLGQHFKLAASLVDNGYSEITEETVSLAEVELPNMMRVWVKPHDNQVDKKKACWKRKHIHVFDSKWLKFPDYNSTLTLIDLSENVLFTIPELLLWGLPELQILNLSENKIRALPGPVKPERINKSSLRVLIISKNKLTGVPLELFQLRCLKKLDLQNNHIASLDPVDFVSRKGQHSEPWHCGNLEELDLFDNKLKSFPRKVTYGAKNLRVLNVSKNNLTMFPDSWPCPMVELKASQNMINSIGNLHKHWSLTLTTLNVGDNELEHVPDTACQLIALKSLNLEKNRIKFLPRPDQCKIYWLEELNLSGNELAFASAEKSSHAAHKKKPGKFSLVSRKVHHPVHQDVNTDSSSFSDAGFDFLDSCKNSLRHLNLSKNRLEAVPSNVCQIYRLLHLDISGNNIQSLPYELARLKNLTQLTVSGETLREPEEVVQAIRNKAQRLTHTILVLLKDRLHDSQPYRGMKLVVVGPAKGGKTSLIRSLIQTTNWPEKDEQINVCSWNMPNPDKIKKKLNDDDIIQFSVWDFKGGDVYEVIQPCLYTDKTLYLLVWDVSSGVQTIDSIRHWLVDIKQKAPESLVILVGRYMLNFRDIDKEEIQSRVDQMNSDRYRLCFVPADIYGSVRGGKKPKDEGSVTELKQMIYHCAATMKGTFLGVTGKILPRPCIIGRKIPAAFLALKDVLDQDQSRGQPKILSMKQILTREDIKKFADVTENISGEDDIQEALDFLTHSGTVFPVKISSGRRIYILDPKWLCHQLYRVCTEIHQSQLKGGKVHFSTLLKEFCYNSGLKSSPKDYFELIEGLEVVLPADRESRWFWIPATLSRDKPMFQFEDKNWPCLRRYYKLPYVPPFFWSRLVSRLIIGLKQFGLQTLQRSQNVPEPELTEVPIFHRSSVSNILEVVAQGLSLQVAELFNWQEGVSARQTHGRILVESYKFADDGNKPGICIQIHCQFSEFKAMGFVVDHIENLIKDHYPGLSDSGIERLVPCHSCPEDKQHTFLVEDLIVAATYEAKDTVACEKNSSIKLRSLVPEVYLKDLEVEVVPWEEIKNVHFTKEFKLGLGGYGEVFKATYDKQTIAVKTLVTSRLVQDKVVQKIASNQNGIEGEESVEEENSLDELDRNTIVDNFPNLRSEVAMLSKLNHPHIIKMGWVCIHKLAFAMEFAPEGDLSAVLANCYKEFLDKHTGEQHIYDMVMDRSLSFKIIVQVAYAVSYLHSKRLIYSDLKTDNVLVFSLDLNTPVNIKLTDYGISRQLIGLGAQGSAGPPGFCAPEVLKHDLFDEKADWFSFSMLLFHIMTGKAPFSNLDARSELAAATLRGERPDFNFCGYKQTPTIPNLEGLMKACWNDQPAQRPNGDSILGALGDASFLCLRSIIHLSEAAVFGIFPVMPSRDGSPYKLHIWSDNKSTVQVEYRQQDMCDISELDGTKPPILKEMQETSNLKVATTVGKLHFIATTFSGIHVYEYTTDVSGPCFKKQAVLVESIIESLSYQPSKQNCKGKLFVGYQENTLGVFNHNEQSGKWSKKPVSIHRFESTDSNFNTHHPCTCMQLVANDTELWVSCGNKIFIVDVSNREDSHVQDIGHVTVVSDNGVDIQGMIHQQGCIWCFVYSQHVGNQVVQYDVTTKECKGRLVLRKEPIVGQNLSAKTCADDVQVDGGSQSGLKSGDDRSHDRNSSIQCILVVEDTLWIGTISGNVIVVSISEDKEAQYGDILGILSLHPLLGESSGPVKHLVHCGPDRVVACQQCLDTHNYQLVVWDRWGTKQFQWFDRVHQISP